MGVAMDVSVDVAKGITVSKMVGVLLTAKGEATREQARDSFVEYIMDNVPPEWSTERPNAALLTIRLDCGGSESYQTAEDIPLVNVPCPCGDPTHWLLKYED